MIVVIHIMLMTKSLLGNNHTGSNENKGYFSAKVPEETQPNTLDERWTWRSLLRTTTAVSSSPTPLTSPAAAPA